MMKTKEIIGIKIGSKHIIAVPHNLRIRTVFQCERGFWWGETTAKDNFTRIQRRWEPKQILLHEKRSNITLPFRTRPSKEGGIEKHEVHKITLTGSEKVTYVSGS